MPPNEKKYQTLFDLTPVGISVVDSEGNIIESNRALSEILRITDDKQNKGIYKERIYIHRDGNLMKPDEFPGSIALREKRTVKEVEIGIILEDGNTIWTEVSASPLDPDANFAVISTVDITQRKILQIKLSESEEQLRLLFENSGEAILLTNPDGSVYSANPEACRIFKITENEICKRGRNGIVDLNDPRLGPALIERKKSGKSKVVLTLIRKDGTKFPAEVTSTIFRDTTGHERTSMIILDISERMQAEKELLLHSEIMKNITEGINLIRIDDEVIVFTNPKFDEMFGYEHGELIGKNISIVNASGAKSPEETKQDIVDAVKSTGEWHGEILNIKKNGDHFWCYVNISMFDHTDYGKVYLSVHSDINKRKQAEEDLKQSLEWQKAIFEGSRDAIFISDQDSRFVAVNKAGADLTGYPLELLLKMRIPDIHHLHDLNAYNMYHRRIFSGEEILSEAKILRSDGLKVDTEFNNRRVFVAGKYYMHTTARDITERKQAVEALRLEKENFRRSLDDSPLGVRIVTAEGNTIYANQAILNIYGYYSLEELQKTPLKKRYTPESYAEAQKRKQQREHGDLGTTSYEISIVRKNGEIRRLQVFRKEVLWDDVSQFQVIYSDITERKQAGDALRQSEMKLKTLFEILPIGVSILDAERNVVFVNPALERILNMTKDAFIKGDYKSRKYLRPDGTQMPEEEFASARAIREQRVIHDVETGILMEDGHVIWTNVNAAPFAFTDWKVVIITTDITDRKMAETTLRESERKVSEALKFNRKILDTSSIGILTYKKSGQCVSANMAAAKATGATIAQLLAQNFHEISSWKKSGMYQVAIKALDTGIEQLMDVHLVTTFGRDVWLSFNFSSFDSEGEQHLLVFTSDINERKQTEEEIRKSKKLLEDLHNHLNEILENERALISREIHDQIGQSLTALKLDLNWLYKYISTNHEAVAKYEGMIELVSNTIKDVQRISSDLRPGILDDLGLAAAIEWYSGEFEERTGIRCRLKLDDSISGNSQNNLVFFRVLQEALTNVIRHANASSVRIILRQSKHGTTMTIQDNGIGIQPGEAESDKSLGLIGMRERVRQYGGRVNITSREGQGTKLTVFIPEKKNNV